MSKINVSTITNRTGTSGPVLSGVTTATNGFHVTGGSVGIGTDNPGDKLSIFSGPNSLVIGAKDTTRGNHAFQVLIDDSAGNGELRLYKNSASGTHEKTVEIQSTGNSYFTGGNLGIGTDNPAKALHIAQNSDCAIRIDANNSNANARTWEIIVGGNASNNAEMILRTRQDDGTGGSECARFTRTGSIKLPSGGGIDFSATGDLAGKTSELLDDYEEGTWDPTIDQGWDNITYAAQHGWYTKIGNTINLGCSIQFSGTSTNNQIYVSLPFEPFNDSDNSRSGAYLTFMNVPAATNTTGMGVAFYIYQGYGSSARGYLLGGGGATWVSNGNASNDWIELTAVYRSV